MKARKRRNDKRNVAGDRSRNEQAHASGASPAPLWQRGNGAPGAKRPRAYQSQPRSVGKRYWRM